MLPYRLMGVLCEFLAQRSSKRRGVSDQRLPETAFSQRETEASSVQIQKSAGLHSLAALALAITEAGEPGHVGQVNLHFLYHENQRIIGVLLDLDLVAELVHKLRDHIIPKSLKCTHSATRVAFILHQSARIHVTRNYTSAARIHISRCSSPCRCCF